MLCVGMTHFGRIFEPFKRRLRIAEGALAAIVVERGFIHCVNNSCLGGTLEARERLGGVLFRSEALLGAQCTDIHCLYIIGIGGSQRPFIALFFVLRRADALLIANGQVEHCLDMAKLGSTL